MRHTDNQSTGRATLALLFSATLLSGGLAAAPQGGLPPVPVPAENRITSAKAVLGKMLFWDEQLSSDNTTACGTCHLPHAGGIDSRFGRHPGRDGQPNTQDDVFGSLGVVHADANRDFEPDATFGTNRQVTRRTAMPNLTAQWSPTAFWDGRAAGRFVDPETNQVAIQSGGALESQAIGPILDAAEMGHEGRTWSDVRNKLQNAEPMRLATNLPADIQAALAIDSTYPALFQRAFGSSAISARHIAFAIATYQRTLVPDQTPFDRFLANQPNTMTQRQINGWNRFRGSRCARCHTPPLFTNNQFRNIGLRPTIEDLGRQEVTNNTRDRGRFKVPSLRNAGLRNRFMHNGEFRSIQRVMAHYRNPRFRDNLDRDIGNGIGFGSRQADGEVADFLQNALIDPRVRNETAPFDRPRLRSEVYQARHYGSGSAGAAGIPRTLAGDVWVDNDRARIGSSGGRPGAAAVLLLAGNSQEPAGNAFGLPVNVGLGGASAALATTLAPSSATGGGGYATTHLLVPNVPSLRGQSLYVQWFVQDSTGVSGFATTRGAQITIAP